MENRDYYMRRAEVGFKTLVIYFSVTRPQYEKAYHKDGKFNKDVLIRQMDFLSTWDNRSKREKELLARRYSEYARTFNYTFDIPVGLVKEILGKYRRSRISIKEITDKLKAEGWLEVKNAGTRTKKGEDGKAHVVCWWHKKYLIANKKYWLQLLSDEKYSDYQKYPRDEEGFVQRAVSIIAEYRTDTIKTEEKDMTTVDEEKEAFIQEAGWAEPMPEVDVHIEEKQDDIYADIPPEQPKQEVKVEAIKIEEKPVVEVQKVEIPEEPKPIMKLTSSQKRRLDNYIERVKDGVLSKETFRKYLKEEFGDVIEETKAYIMANIRR